jgi:hypothetical protein
MKCVHKPRTPVIQYLWIWAGLGVGKAAQGLNPEALTQVEITGP